MPNTFAQIEDKIVRKQPLDRDDAVFLFRFENDLHKIGMLADHVKREISKLDVYYNVNVHLNPTNVCQFRCPLCAFSCDSGNEKAYRLSDAEIFEIVKSAYDSGCTELHWVGGIPKGIPYSWYLNTLTEIHSRFPDLRIKAWTAVEIVYFAESTGRDIKTVLTELKAAGLSALPGGGAEIFDPEIRKIIAPDKADAESWLNVHRAAHELGITTNTTMLFGSFETAEHRIDHILRLRDLQDESIRENRPAKFDTFVPLVFHPYGTAFADLEMIPAHEILRTIAVSRLLFHNIPHIKAYWITLGPQLAQIALGYGADDFDGTVHKERIHHEAGSKSPDGLSETQIIDLITETGRTAVRR